jgi:sigma-B regulation protein RsbU (phosphoserine phosphatase)
MGAASLIVRTADGRKATYELSQRPLTLGRAESCDVVLRHDAGVSREHAQVWLDESGQVLVADLNSKNGTRVDGGEVFRGQTRPAYRSIQIGQYEIAVVGAAPVPDADTGVRFVADAGAFGATSQFFPSSKGLDLNQQRLSLLMSLADRIGGAFERKQLLEQALEACCEALKFERGLIVLKTSRGEPELPLVRNVERDASGAYQVSRTLINRALLHGERAVVNNPATDLIGNLSESLMRFPIRSALCVPILHRDEILGVIYGDRVTTSATYSPEDVDFLAAIARQVGVGLANLRLLEEYVRLQKVEAELSAARRIQQDLLPAHALRTPTVRLEGYNEPSAEVGGDYYDYFELDDGRIGFVIADVTGHGLPAALLMANFQAAVRVCLAGDTPLPELAARLNRLVCRNTAANAFITAAIGTVDTQSGLIEYVSAGHPAPILVGCPRAPDLEEHNALPLGIDPQETFPVQRLGPTDHAGVILFYTDGLTELANADGKLLGNAAVRKALTELGDLEAQSAIRAALELARQHRGTCPNADDLTLLAIQLDRSILKT